MQESARMVENSVRQSAYMRTQHCVGISKGLRNPSWSLLLLVYFKFGVCGKLNGAHLTMFEWRRKDLTTSHYLLCHHPASAPISFLDNCSGCLGISLCILVFFT